MSEDFLQLPTLFQTFIQKYNLESQEIQEESKNLNNHKVRQAEAESSLLSSILFFISGFSWLILDLNPIWVGYVILIASALIYFNRVMR